MMVRKSYGRSLSFPIPNLNRTATLKIKGRGSTSLPCRFHPFISPLEDDIQALLTWRSRPDPSSPAWICDGLAKLDRLHSSLDDLLQHPQAQDHIRRRSAWTDRVLDDFLRLADAYGLFRSAIVNLKDRNSATQAAIWRNDDSRIASCVRSQRRAEKEVAKIAAAVRNVGGRWSPPAIHEDGGAEEAELAGTMREVVAVTAAASSAVFATIAGMSAVVTSAGGGLCSPCMGSASCVILRMGSSKKRLEEEEREGEEKWRREAVERLEALEECVREVEKGSERLFRSLVNSRVFLLNTLTPIIYDKIKIKRR